MSVIGKTRAEHELPPSIPSVWDMTRSGGYYSKCVKQKVAGYF